MSGAAPRSRNTVSDPSWSFEMVVRPWCPATPSARHNSFGGNVRLRGQDPQRFIDYERAAEPDEMSSPLRRIHQGEDEPRIDDALIACVMQIQKATTGEPLPNYNRPSSRARLTAALRLPRRVTVVEVCTIRPDRRHQPDIAISRRAACRVRTTRGPWHRNVQTVAALRL